MQCYMEKATKAWHRQGRREHRRTRNSQSQHKRPSTCTIHRSSTGMQKMQMHRSAIHRSCTVKSTHESSRATATTAAAPHERQMHRASSTQTQRGHRQSLGKRNLKQVRGAGGPCRIATQAPPATAGTRGAPRLGGLQSRGSGGRHCRTASLRGEAGREGRSEGGMHMSE